MTSTSFTVNLGLNSCPTEILCFIIKLVDAKTFLYCRQVCRRWKEIVDNIGESNSLWERFVKEDYLDIYPSLYRKSIMPWFNIYRNIKLWQKVENATETKVRSMTYKLLEILKIHVYKDNVIVVCTSCVRYYSIADFSLIRIMTAVCLDCQENDQMNLILQSNGSISLYGKSANSNFLDNPIPLDENQSDIVCYSLEDNACYFINKKRTLWVCTFNQNKWAQTFLAKDYGTVPILSINVWRDKVYMLLQNGKIYQAIPDMKQFLRVCSTITPQYIKNGYLFNKYDVLFSVAVTEDFMVRKCHDHINIRVPADVTCILLHGEMLLLGYVNNLVGFHFLYDICMIEIYSTKAIEFPQCTTVLSRPTRDLERILAMDIYESQDKHTIIVATNFTIHVIAYTHSSGEKEELAEEDFEQHDKPQRRQARRYRTNRRRRFTHFCRHRNIT